jgi:hypothetical protein
MPVIMYIRPLVTYRAYLKRFIGFMNRYFGSYETNVLLTVVMTVIQWLLSDYGNIYFHRSMDDIATCSYSGNYEE